MKIYIPILALSATLFSMQSYAQKSYKQKPLLLAKTEQADYGLSNNWYARTWRISPQISNDTLKVKLYSNKEDFAFRTDLDSIKFSINRGETKSFYVKLADKEPAYTLITAEPYNWDPISYDTQNKRTDIKQFYQNSNNKYFDSLRTLYPTAQLIKNNRTDLDKVLNILNWTHHQWKHDGGNSPKGSDGISILNEAMAGGRFPCFAYSIVLKDQLIANGFPARVLYIKTKDAETRKGSPGHVVTEVFLKDINKWVFADGQFNVIPTLNGKPLNAVEFQKALSENYDKLILASRDKISKRNYVDFVYDYLYYLDTALDNRNLAANDLFKIDGKRSLMLVPNGAPNLTKISFWNSDVNYCVYTNSIKDFYANPE